jgi:hypothetical protein
VTLKVKLIIEAATGGKMPDLIKKKIDHRLYCHHYHFMVSLYVGHCSNSRRRHCPSIMISIFERNKITTLVEKMAYVNKTRWNVRMYVRACVHICACVNDNQVSGNGSSGATCKHNTTHCHKERT